MSIPERRETAVLVPVAHHIEPLCEAGLTALERMGYPVFRVRGHSDIARGRSQMATQALEQGHRALMWIDADMMFVPEDVERFRQGEHALVGGVYPVKGQRRLTMRPLPGTTELVFGEQGDVVEVLYLATGFLFTRAEVYADIQRRLELPRCGSDPADAAIPFFLSIVANDGGTPSYLSEDFSFCYRARVAGHRVMADTRVRLGHIGTYVYTVEDAGRDRVLHPSFRFRPMPEHEGAPGQ